MALDLNLLGEKLNRCREQFQVTIEEVSAATGIPAGSLQAYESSLKQPTGDEILALADYYKCDYQFFISSERVASFEQTEILFRKHGEEFSKADRWAVQEFLFLCESEQYLLEKMAGGHPKEFRFPKQGNYYKGHGVQAAKELRRFLDYPENEVVRDIYKDLRLIGIHVFRRKLTNSNISGLFVKHPVAGRCILVNYSEDVYRQRFTAAHEAAHAILDDEEIGVSFESDKTNLSEVRANVFASHYLLPPEALSHIPDRDQWDAKKVVYWANESRVSVQAMVYALKDAQLITDENAMQFGSIKIPPQIKVDPELPETLTPKAHERRDMLLQLGLSVYYVDLCFEGYGQGFITAGRLAEMLLASESDLAEIANMFGRRLEYDV